MSLNTLEFRVIAEELEFPEGPVALPDGSVLVVEIKRGAITRVLPDRSKETVSLPGGGPNGLAIGPDGRCFVCNNGGFQWHVDETGIRPTLQPDDYSGGRIEVVDLESGRVEVLYTEADGLPLSGPNDIVFDDHGGFYFSDLGKVRAKDQDRGRVMYGLAAGVGVKTVAAPL